MMFSIFPFPHGLLIKNDSMRKWSKEHKNYIQLQVTVKEFGGQGACSLLHAFLTNLFLCNLSDSLNIERPVRKEADTHLILLHVHQQIHQASSSSQMFGISEL